MVWAVCIFVLSVALCSISYLNNAFKRIAWCIKTKHSTYLYKHSVEFQSTNAEFLCQLQLCASQIVCLWWPPRNDKEAYWMKNNVSASSTDEWKQGRSITYQRPRAIERLSRWCHTTPLLGHRRANCSSATMVIYCSGRKWRNKHYCKSKESDNKFSSCCYTDLIAYLTGVL